MALTNAPVADRFFAPEITEVLFVPVVANSNKSPKDPTYLVPTAAELGAGIRITDDIADWSGWNVTSNFIDTPDLSSRYTSRITGRTSSDDSSITFYASVDGEDVRSILPRGTKGFLVIADGGLGAGKLADVFPVEVGSVSKVRSVADNANQLTIGFAIKRQPGEDITLVAIP